MTAKTTAKESERILPSYREKLMGIPVILHKCAIEVRNGNEISTAVPDVKGLEAALAVARISIPAKLSGKEIKFVRRVLGKKANELAKQLDITPEHFSRIENGNAALTTNTERIFRWHILRELRDKAPYVRVKAEEILDMSFPTFRSTVAPVTLIFTRTKGAVNGVSRHVWIFEGAENVSERSRAIA